MLPLLHADAMDAIRGCLHLRGPAGACVAALAAALGVLSAAQPATAQEISMRAERQGEFVVVSATVELQVEQRLAWDVLADYDHLAEFIPDMQSSRVLARNADGVIVEQKGEIGFLIFRQPVDVRLVVSEFPPQRIVARAISGNLKEMEARYELESSSAGVKISYFGRFIPDFLLPPVFGTALVYNSLAKQFRAMVAEIQRRDALARNRTKP